MEMSFDQWKSDNSNVSTKGGSESEKKIDELNKTVGQLETENLKLHQSNIDLKDQESSNSSKHNLLINTYIPFHYK